MKKRYTEEQIISAVKLHDAGKRTEVTCREMGISKNTFYNWRSKYAGVEVNAAKRMRTLESENNQLKKLLAEKVVEVEALKDIVAKKW